MKHGEITVPTPNWIWGFLNVALRVNISVCVLCMLGDTLDRIDY